MRYFNKEWYELMQKQFMTDGITEILDKEYCDKEIEELYNKELKKEIERAYEDYNTPPDYSFLEELINGDEPFELEDWLIVDEDNDKTIVPTSKEQVIVNISKEKERDLEEFNNRPPFDEKETIENFEQAYKAMIEIKDYYPKWVYDEVDNRLIALNLLPKGVLKKLRAEEKENKKRFDKIMKEARKVLNKQDVPEKIQNQLSLHDDRITAFEKQGNNYVMTIENYDDEVIQIVFEEADIIEFEELDFENCYWLYEEIYKENNMYEVHIMVDSNGLKYVTVRCEEIE